MPKTDPCKSNFASSLARLPLQSFVAHHGPPNAP